jgi:hypothetical protein
MIENVRLGLLGILEIKRKTEIEEKIDILLLKPLPLELRMTKNGIRKSRSKF